jgi:hypothetical protein
MVRALLPGALLTAILIPIHASAEVRSNTDALDATRGLREVRPRTGAAPSGQYVFGASTMVADFDADGAADRAIVVRDPLTEAFRFDFLLSGQTAQVIRFRSPVPLLEVAVRDVDRDRDVDLIVTAKPGREIVAVWLNDGRGRWTAGNLDAVTPDPVELRRTASFRTWSVPLATPPAQRKGLAADSNHREPFTASYASGPRRLHDTARNAALLSSVSPRAPPITND